MSAGTPHGSPISGIAIIGMVCRVAGASNIDEFWRNLTGGVESIRSLTREESLAAGAKEEDIDAPGFVLAAAAMDGIELFDADFFGINAREAELMDPQHRLLLECGWEALEDAGYDPFRYEGAIGVFSGNIFDSYATVNLMPSGMFDDSSSVLQAVLANKNDYLTTRLSYKLNLRGPSYAVQSGCSTSLVAVHLACQNLLNYESDIALAGGVAIDVTRGQGYQFHEGSVFSRDGHCRAFDARAQGTVFGNGMGMVVLKRLADALRDGDAIRGVILGSAVNNDGSHKVGFTAPSVSGQSSVISEAMADAGVEPDTIGYVETHGTGTLLGDPIEIEAMGRAFGPHSGAPFCSIGSLKTNVGHLDAAAGVCGLIKATLSLERRAIVPSLNFETPNPSIDFAATPFRVATKLQPWTAGTRSGLPRRAGVSSFGMGGTNAHVVLQEAPETPVTASSRPAELVVISARTAAALEEATDRVAQALTDRPDLNIADVAYTLQVGRGVFSHRRAIVCRGTVDAAATLTLRDPAKTETHEYTGAPCRVAFMFPGEATQWNGMTGELYRTDAVFRAHVDRCCDLARPHVGADLRDVLTGGRSSTGPTAEGRLLRIEHAQPALFIVEYALAQMWKQYGISAAAYMGHGVGEYVAACLSGVFSLADALAIVAVRGRIMYQANQGAVTDGAVQPLVEMVTRAQRSAPQVPLVSSVTGTWLTSAEAADPHYWVRQLQQPVKYAETVSSLIGREPYHLLEVGPGRALASLAANAVSDGRLVAATLPQADAMSEIAAVLETLGRLWQRGAAVDWEALRGSEARRRVPLPTYPFERKRYWVDPEPEPEPEPPPPAVAKQEDVARWFSLPEWRQTPQPRYYAGGRRAGVGGRWLVFTGANTFSEDVCEQLAADADPSSIITVAIGERYERLSLDRYTVAPTRPEDFRLLFESLNGEGRCPDVVVHLWTAADSDLTSDAAQDRGFYSLIWIAQALGGLKRASVEPIPMKVVTSGTQPVLGVETIRPEHATLVGASIVIGQEYSNIRCRVIDIAADAESLGARAGRASIVRQIADELVTDAPEGLVAYRLGRRYTPVYEPLPVDVATPSGLAVRDGGVYLITGGFGSIGSVFARHLAVSRARLALVSRFPLPGREQWTEWLGTHAESDSTSRRIRSVMALEEQGAEVMALAADITNPDQMSAVVAKVVSQFGNIHGVIQAAGVVDETAFAPIAEIRPRECDNQFRPKMLGLAALERALGDRPLDFCFVVSSLSSVLGGLRYAGYAAINTFMDAFVHRHNHLGGTPWVSVNWDAWTFQEPAEGQSNVGLQSLALTPKEATVAFDHLLRIGPVGQVIVSTANLYPRIKEWIALHSTAAGQAGEAAKSERQLYARPAALEGTFEAPSTPFEETVAGIWQQVLGIERVGRKDNFFDLGGHSLLAVQVLAKLGRAYDIQVPLRLMFDALTVAELADGVQTLVWSSQGAAGSTGPADVEVEELEI